MSQIMSTYMEVGAVGIIVSLFVLMIMNLMKSQKTQNEDLDEIKSEEIIKLLMEDKLPKAGSSKNRKNSAPEKGKTSLLEVKNA